AVLVLDSGSAIVEVQGVPEGNRLHVRVNGVLTDLLQKGVYRFDTAPEPTLRVFDGVAAVDRMPLRDGQTTTLPSRPGAVKFDRGVRDDFHYWAALRSLSLRTESIAGPRNWTPDGRGVVSHSGFDVEFGGNAGTAMLQYLTAVRAGTVYYVEGQV